jgi:hypothetical protein
MDPAHAIVAIMAVGGAFVTPIAIVYMWLHRPSAKKLPPSVGDSATEARLERIENAVQAIAIETERIAEGQRFTTKLMTSPERLAEHGRSDLRL